MSVDLTTKNEKLLFTSTIPLKTCAHMIKKHHLVELCRLCRNLWTSKLLSFFKNIYIWLLFSHEHVVILYVRGVCCNILTYHPVDLKLCYLLLDRRHRDLLSILHLWEVWFHSGKKQIKQIICWPREPQTVPHTYTHYKVVNLTHDLRCMTPLCSPIAL